VGPILGIILVIVLGTGSTKLHWRCKVRRLLVVLVVVLVSVALIGCTVEQQRAGAELYMSLDPTQQALLASLETNIGFGATSTGSMPEFVKDVSHDAWSIEGTERLGENPVVAGWLSRLRDPAPELWKVFPNVPNPDVPEFRVLNGDEVPDGMEYGTYDSPYCSSHPCDIPVGAWEYRYISGDYNFLGTECKGDKSTGCMLVLINVMDESYTWRNQDVDNGFTLRGRYWNGDTLEWGIWGLVSHGGANMLNMETFAREGEVLNAGAPGNSGANCGNPLGCESVDVTLVVHAGDAIIAVAKTTVTK